MEEKAKRKRKPKDTPLTVKAEKFADAMADPANTSATQAAIDAGYAADPTLAAVTANRLLKNVKIRDRIEERKAIVARYANITAAQVLGATALRAFATIDDAFDDNGYFDIDKARETGAIHLIKKISRSQTQFGENVAVEFYSNEAAQDKLGSYLGMDKLPAENPHKVEKVLASFHLWLEKNPAATVQQKVDAIRDFASFGKIDEKELGLLAGVDVQIEQVQ